MNSLAEYFKNIYNNCGTIGLIHSCPDLMECIQQVGFLPLLESGIQGYAAESLMGEECRFTQFEDGSWEWPLWQWKGSVVREGCCVMASSLLARRVLSVVNGGPISTTGVEVKTLCRKMEA